MNNMALIPYLLISSVCLWIVLSAIVINFFLSNRHDVKKEKKSIVETGSMLAFFIVMVFLVFKKVGTLSLNMNATIWLAIFGTSMIIIGTVFNVVGRVFLKGNWGNQIKIYTDHTLVQDGIYRFVRHPLYSSTILMIYGFSFLFANPIVFLLNTVVFIPFMVYRAKQEEVLLSIAFEETYKNYKSKTGMLFPKFRK